MISSNTFLSLLVISLAVFSATSHAQSPDDLARILRAQSQSPIVGNWDAVLIKQKDISAPVGSGVGARVRIQLVITPSTISLMGEPNFPAFTVNYRLVGSQVLMTVKNENTSLDVVSTGENSLELNLHDPKNANETITFVFKRIGPAEIAFSIPPVK